MVTRITVVRFLPFVALHSCQSLKSFLLGRVLLTMAMAWAKQPIVGVEYLVLMPLLTAALLTADRRRTGARDLFANLGFGARELLAIGALLALVAEAMIELLAAGTRART